jgi:hypothetical protein
MQNMTTAPTIRRTIMWKLHIWRKRQQDTLNLTDEYGERAAAIAQDRIGWTNLMLGRAAGEWAAAQQDYLDYLGRRKTGKRWLIAITAKLLKISWDMWDHRNGILHHKDHLWKQAESKALNSSIEDKYDQGPLHLDEGAQWLWRTTQAVKDLLIEAKQQWLRSVELARRTYDRATAAEYRSMRNQNAQLWLRGCYRRPRPCRPTLLPQQESQMMTLAMNQRNRLHNPKKGNGNCQNARRNGNELMKFRLLHRMSQPYLRTRLCLNHHGIRNGNADKQPEKENEKKKKTQVLSEETSM